ncbi:MAG: ADP-ribosylglycohydrolase family protein [Armatimonadota bacterium]
MDRYERIAGSLLGGAVGDALGAPVEFMSIANIRSAFGPHGITNYAPAYGRIGAITDDTQMALFTLEGLLSVLCAPYADVSCQEAVCMSYIRWLGTQGTVSHYEALASVYSGWLWQRTDLHSNRAPGNSCLSSLKKHLVYMEQNDCHPSNEPINDSKGCGGVMRMAPVGFFDLDCFRIGCEAAQLTHGHPSGYLSSGFLAHMIHELLQANSLTEAIDSARSELVKWPSHHGTLHAVDQAVIYAETKEATPECIEQMGGGWVAEQALAISLFCALKADDFVHGVRLAVNHSGDSDSTGAITGNILGAMWGRRAISDEFLQTLELRSVIEQMALDAANLNHPDEWRVRYSIATVTSPIVTPVKGCPPKSAKVQFARSYWVSQDELLAGCYPGDSHPEKAIQKLSGLLDAGIRTALCLQEAGETGHSGHAFKPYVEKLQSLAEDRGVAVKCVRMAVEDNNVPTRAFMTKILDFIDSCIANGSPVFVHCWGGQGRTGTVVGCWLARHGIAQGDDALKMIQRLRRNEQTASSASPETAAQCDMVRTWGQRE